MGHTQRYKSGNSKKKRRTRRKKIYGGVIKKQHPTKKYVKTTHDISRKAVKFGKIIKHHLRRSGKKIKNNKSIPDSILPVLLKSTEHISLLSEDSLYAIVESVTLKTPIQIGYEKTNKCIMKLCIISPTSIEFPGRGGLSKKVSYTRKMLEDEFSSLSINSQLGICPIPFSINFFSGEEIIAFFKTIDTKILQEDRNIFPSLRQLWRNLQQLKKKEIPQGSPSQYGLGVIVMENIEGISSIDELTKNATFTIAILIKILYKLVLLYINGFIHTDCHLNNIRMRSVVSYDPAKNLLEYTEGSIEDQIAKNLSQYDKEAILIDFGDVVKHIHQIDPLTDLESCKTILKNIFEFRGRNGRKVFDGWMTDFGFSPMNIILDSTDPQNIALIQVLFDYYIQNSPFRQTE